MSRVLNDCELPTGNLKLSTYLIGCHNFFEGANLGIEMTKKKFEQQLVSIQNFSNEKSIIRQI